jgi:putative ABC transport system permease protein
MIERVERGHEATRSSFEAMLFLMRVLSARRLWQGPLRTILVIGAVAVGVALFLASVMAGEASVASFAASSSGTTSEGVLTCHAASGTITERDVGALGALVGERYTVVPVIEFLAMAGIAPIRVFGIDGNLVQQDDRGRGDSTDGVISPHSPLLSSVESTPSEGSPILIELQADGITSVFSVRTQDHPLISQRRAIYLDLSALEQWLPHRAAFTAIYLVPLEERKGGFSQDEIARLREELFHFNPNLIIESDAEQAGRMDSLLSAFRMNVLVMVLMTLVVTGLLVENAMRVHAFHAMKDMQILRTLGVTGFGASMLLLIDAIIIGAIGSLLGVWGGGPLVTAVSHMLMKTAQEMYLPDLEFSALGLGRRAAITATAFGIGMVVSVAGGLFPALQARHTVPTLSARPVEEGKGRSSHLRRDGALLIGCGSGLWIALTAAWSREQIGFAYLAVVLLGGLCVLLVSLTVHGIVGRVSHLIKRVPRVVTLLAAGSSEIGEREVVRSVRTMAAGLALLLGLSILVTSFQTTLQEWVAHTFSEDLFIKPIGANDPRNPAVLSPAQTDKIAAVRGVERVFRTRGYLVDVDGVSLSLYGAEVDDRAGGEIATMQFLAGNYDAALFAAGQGVLLSESGARRLRRTIGETVEIWGTQLPIIGIYRDYTRERGTILMGWEPFVRGTKNRAAESVSVRFSPGGDPHIIKHEVEEVIGSAAVTVLSMEELRDRIDELFRSTFAITGVLEGIILLVTLAGFLIASIQRYTARESEFKMVRTLGVSRREVAIAAAIEGLVSVVPAVVAGACGGGLLGWILIAYVNPLSFGWSLSLHLRWSEIIGSGVAFVLLAALCSAVAAGGVYRHTARGGFRDE